MKKHLNSKTAIGCGEIKIPFFIKLYKKNATAYFLRNKSIKQYIPVNLSMKLMTFFIQIGINSNELTPFTD